MCPQDHKHPFVTGVRLSAETQTFAVNNGEGKIRDVHFVNLASEVSILGFSWCGLRKLGQDTNTYRPGTSGPTMAAALVSTGVQEATEAQRERTSLPEYCPSGLYMLLNHFIQTKMSLFCLLNNPKNLWVFWAEPKHC